MVDWVHGGVVSPGDQAVHAALVSKGGDRGSGVFGAGGQALSPGHVTVEQYSA